MANDQKPPAKTIMGWVPPPGQAPGQTPPATPSWQPPAPAAAPPQPWQPQPPQAAPMPAPAPAWQPPPAAPPSPQWGAPPPGAPQPPPQWGAPPPGAPQPPPQWGAPPPGAPQPPPQWGAPPQPPQPAPPPAWGGQPPQPAWGGAQPPQQPWNQPPPPAPQPWGAPAPAQSFGGMPQQGRNIAGADATVGVSARMRFIRLTYLHLLGAILAFAALEWLLFRPGKLFEKVSAPLIEFALGGRFNWAIVLGVFTIASFIAHYLADHTRSKALHYTGLAIYTIAEALIFVPLLAIVQWKTATIIAKGGGDPNILRDAAYITLGVFGALTASVFFTKKDFSFLGSALAIAGAAAMGLIVLSLIFGFNLGIVFAIAMVLLAAGQILFKTSQIMAHDDPDHYVGAALGLFASVALMFWYVIQILMKLRE